MQLAGGAASLAASAQAGGKGAAARSGLRTAAEARVFQIGLGDAAGA